MIGLAVAALDGGGVREAVASVDPAVKAHDEAVGHPMRVLEGIARIKDGALVGLACSLAVDQPVDVRDAEDHCLRAPPNRPGGWQRQDSDGNVQPVGKGGDLPGPAIGAEIFKDLDGVAALAIGRSGEGILDGVGDPEPAAIVESDVEGLVNVRLGGDQLDLKPWRHVELPGLFSRVQRRSRDNVGIGLGGNEGQHGQQSCCRRACSAKIGTHGPPRWCGSR